MSDVPSCCYNRGLDFEDGHGPVCTYHQTPQQRALVTRLDRRGFLMGLLRHGPQGAVEWPYGLSSIGTKVSSRMALLEWMEADGVAPAPSLNRTLRDAHRVPCLHWVRDGVCREPACREWSATWMRHTSGWERGDGVRLLVSQPYSLSAEDRDALAVLDADPDLRVQVEGGGWYGANYIVQVWGGEAKIAAEIAASMEELTRMIAEMFRPARVNAEVAK